MIIEAPPRLMGKVLGRQPDVPHVIPSKPNAWYGTIVEGERFTRQQLAALARRGIDPATVDAITVTRNATIREMYWPLGSLPPVYQFECPVLGRQPDRRIRIIAPIGDEKLVYSDGWPTPPPIKRRRAR
jgi:hypothetical protein